MKLSFTKMQGCANDYIYLDCRKSGVPENIAALSEKLSRRHFSIGADGIICICAPVTPGADGRMRIFNADGSEAQMCGNGVRCVAEWFYTHGVEKPVLTIDTNSGVKRITRQGAQLWQVEMGAYSTLPADLPAIHMGEGPLVDQPLTVEGKVWKVTCISVGNPHCVTVVEDVDSLKLEAIGPAFEHHANFPERINTEFVQVVDAAHLKMRVWERGSGETWACGTGTCATVAALTEMQKEIQEGVIAAGNQIVDNRTLFGNGQVAFHIDAPSQLKNWTEVNVTTSLIPGSYSFSSDHHIIASANTEHPEECALFIDYMTGIEAMGKYTSFTDVMPGRTSVEALDYYKNLNDNMSVFYKAAAQCKALPVNSSNFVAAMELLATAVQRVTIGNEDPATVAAETHDQLVEMYK